MVSDALVDLVSGSAGGVANVVVGQPMDTVKVFRQDLVFMCCLEAGLIGFTSIFCVYVLVHLYICKDI